MPVWQNISSLPLSIFLKEFKPEVDHKVHFNHCKDCYSYIFGILQKCTDSGRPMKPFFIKIPNFWAWADKFGGIWGIFSQTINSDFCTASPLCMFSINQPLFLQKLSLYIQIPNIYFGLGFEYGSQKN